jgi:NAD(P)-dependent dehydrogenase (short-subunit alcohol dehydrogenase family)
MIMSAPSGRLADKVALVTGAASGIGFAVTQLFLSEGARVLAIDISETSIASASSLLKSQGFEPDSHLFHQADVADEESVVAFVEKCVDELGGLDIVVLNAGIGMVKPIAETCVEDYEKHMKVNARGRKLDHTYHHLDRRGY